MVRCRTARPLLLSAICALLLLTTGPIAGLAAQDVLQVLEHSSVYVSPQLPASAVGTNAAGQLTAQVNDAASKGVQEKIALLHSYPSNYPNAASAASGLRHYLDFPGTLILVAPSGYGISSGDLGQDELTHIADTSHPYCVSSFTTCAVHLAQAAETQVRADRQSNTRNSIIFWVIAVLVVAAVVLFIVFRARGRRRAEQSRLEELRKAVRQTLAMADTAVQEIEGATNGGRTLTADQRAEYDRALGLRDRAEREAQAAGSDPQLVQANQDAAQAVLAMQGVMRSLGLKSEMVNPLDVPERRCFYCGRSDRPPYYQETISDDRGNTMQVDVCSVDHQLLEEGRKPQIATVHHDGLTVPWWAVPSSPWYYAYGGPTWQYWLPFFFGMDVGGWFGGGWGAPVLAGNFGGPGWGPDGGWGDQQPADIPATPSDAAGGNFGPFDSGNWGGDSSAGWDNSGGWDSGDSGGWDMGGGDSGGWDSGGGNDSGGWS